MAGIDNNTLLYLRGDSFKDLSPNALSLNVVGNPLIKTDSFRFNSTNKYIQIDSPILTFNSDFTIEYFIKFYDTHSYQPIFICGQAYNEIFDNSHYSNRLDFGGGVGGTGMHPPIHDAELEVWYHFAVVRKNGVLTAYRNGIKFGNSFSSTFTPKRVLYGINRDPYYPNNWCNISLKNFRISNIARYTEDFTPPTQPFNSITINKTNQTDTNIEFNIEKLGQETINKVEVLVNGTVSETYSDNYDNIDYLIDTELCVVGNNNITIRVTFDDIYTEELSLTHKVNVDELPLETPLLDTVERVKLLTKSKQSEKNMLSNILTSKNVEVSEEDKMSDLIGKVDLLGANPEKLYLYKYGDECVDVTGGWVNTVSNMENTEEGLVITNSTYYSTVYPNNMVDLSEFNTLCMEYKLTYGTGVILATSKNKNSNVGAHLISSTWDNSNVPLNEFRVIRNNINSLSGSHYTCVIGIDSSNYIITKIWLEK